MWINMANDKDTCQVMVLMGVAGFGKSAIAHTIAQHYRHLKRLGSCFCFNRDDQAKRSPGNVLSTLARDIANIDPEWKMALFNATENDDSLRHSISPELQMEQLILQPAEALTMAGPVVIVIDALDESGDSSARANLLRVLAENAPKLPPNFRILVTARQEDDIIQAFREKPHVQLKYTDNVDEGATKDDIAKFIEKELSSVAKELELSRPNKQWVFDLVEASGHLFQWAATACLAILHGTKGLTKAGRLKAFVSGGRGLDSLYTTILGQTFDVDENEVMNCFRQVMGGIMAAKEPLPISSHSSLQEDANAVQEIVKPLGSLLHGIDHADTPIRALHASFFDFLRDEKRSKQFFVDSTYPEHDQKFVRSCLRIMKNELRFNICNLETSYLRNTDIKDLQARMKQYITPHLSYACRFLDGHLKSTMYDDGVSRELQELLQKRFLYN